MTVPVAILLSSIVSGSLADDGKSWNAKAVEHEKDALYALSYCATPGGEGVLTGGPRGFNMDFTVKPGVVKERRNIFVYPAEAKTLDIRLGTWNMPLGAKWSDVRSIKVRPQYNELPGGLKLGAGEAIDGDVYRFYRREFNVQGPHVRPLLRRSGASFNSNRWCIYGESHVDYLFELEGRRLLDFKVDLPLVHYSKGAVKLCVSHDGKDWREIAHCGKRDIFSGSAPAEMFPAERIYVRVVGVGGTSLQTGFPRVTAKIDGKVLRAAGFTRYIDEKTGEKVTEVGASGYYDESWGEAIAVDGDGFVLWRADEEMRVAPWRSAPKTEVRGLTVSAAANEAEAVQLVVKAGAADVAGVKVTLKGDLVGRGGGRIPAAAVDIRQVTYLNIRDISDRTSAPGLWPEVLEDVPAQGVVVPVGQNRSFWVRVKVPKGTAKGRYVGRLVVSASGRNDAVVPFGVEVFGFELPDRMTLQTSFGYTQSRAFSYHGVSSAADKRKVNEIYLKVLSQAHLSPYHPGRGILPSSWKYKIETGAGESGSQVRVIFDWDKWDEGMRKVLDEYNFNTFIFTIPGFESRNFANPSKKHVFHGREEGTPEYEALVAKYLGGIEAHLREKGWLDVAYLYWYDEPTADKFQFLDRGLKTVKKYAPSIRRMITKEPCAGLFDGVSLWCPTPDHINNDFTGRCRERGDQFWWYVCMQPKAPYATEFIDHPGTDLRVWLWQTWQHRVTGILIWETVYWSSPTIYGEKLQNPYEDAASWSDMGTGPKTFRYNWGNGDGRFLYPPRACFGADGVACTSRSVLKEPNGTIRLEILRDGIEDYEYFTILSQLDSANGLLKVPEDVSASLTEFTVDSKPIKAHRRKLAKEIERLKGLKK